MRVTMSAVVGGKKTNRVRVRKRPASAGTAKVAYRKDPAIRGMDTVVVCISMPVSELESIDEICARVQMARSHFLRQAAKHFTEKVRPR